MTIELILECKPFSVNAYRYRDARFKTAEARAWETQVLELLEDFKELHDMADMWRKSGGVFRVSLTAVYPSHVFFNKAKQVSAKTMDLTNWEKPLVDLVFNEFMQVDDRYITECSSRKIPGASQRILIELELRPNYYR